MEKQAPSSSIGMLPLGDDGGDDGGGVSSPCGSMSPFSTADYAILQNHQQPRHHIATLPMLPTGVPSPHENGNGHYVPMAQHQPTPKQEYTPRYPSHQPRPQSHSPLEHQHMTQNQQYHPHRSQQQIPPPPETLPRHPLPSTTPQAGVTHPAASTPWTLGSTDGSYAVSLALMMEQQQILEGTEVEAGGTSPHPDLSVSTMGMHSSPPGGPNPPTATIPGHVNPPSQSMQLAAQKSLYQDRLLRQSSAAVEAVLAASCEVMGFDIAELWVRTGHKTHQLTNSHLRPTALDDSVRKDLVDVYYGEKSNERTHRLSPALCKRAKEAGDVVWVTAHSATGAQALRCSISNVRTAVAVPVCHESSNTNITIIFFSVRR
jgi:hypothetical protein